MNSVVLSPGKLHQYPVLSCGKHLYDFHITNGGRFGSTKQIYSLHLQVPVPSQESGDHIQCMCVTGNQFNLSMICRFYWNFSDGGIFLLSHYFLKKKPVQSCLNPSSSLITIYFVFFLQNGRGNNIQI